MTQQAKQPLTKLSYSIAEARAVTGVGENSIRNAVKRGDLKAVRLGLKGSGSKYLISAESLKSWVTPPTESK